MPDVFPEYNGGRGICGMCIEIRCKNMGFKDGYVSVVHTRTQRTCPDLTRPYYHRRQCQHLPRTQSRLPYRAFVNTAPKPRTFCDSSPRT